LSVIGDIYFDIIATGVEKLPSKWSTDTLATSIIQRAGGSSLNTSIHASHYGQFRNRDIDTINLSAVGDDDFGLSCRKELSRAKVIDKVIMKSGHRTGSCIVLTGLQDRCFVTDRGCINDMKIDWFNLNDILQTDHLHVAGYFNCSGLKENLQELLSTAQNRGISTSLNPQYDASGKWLGLQELCPYLDIITCNEDELKHITANKQQELNTNTEENIIDLVRILCDWGCKIVVVTMGSKGATAYKKDPLNGTVTATSQAAPQVDVTDTTGAGDAFAGAFLVDWLCFEGDLSQALLAGVLAGSAAVMSIGGSVCNRDHLEWVSNHKPAN